MLGENGGIIETNEPDSWWTLDLEIFTEDSEYKDMVIGICNDISGDVIFDPQFLLTIKMESNRLLEAYVTNCLNHTSLGISIVDENNMISGFGFVEKSPTSLVKLFDRFMEDITDIGPYLSTPPKKR